MRPELRSLLDDVAAGLDDDELAHALVRQAKRLGVAALPDERTYPPAPGDPRVPGSRLVLGSVLPDPLVREAALLLQRSAVGARSVVVDRSGAARFRWRWPLRVGVLPHPAAASVVAALHGLDLVEGGERRESGQGLRLAEVSVAHHGGRFELLLSLGGAAETARRLLGPVRCQIGCLVITGRGPTDDRAARASLREHAPAVAHVRRTPGQLGPWFRSLLTELSHDVPLDVALRTASVTPSGHGDVLLEANTRWLEGTRVSVVASRLAITLDPRALSPRFEGTHVSPRSELAYRLLSVAMDTGFMRESTGASVIRRLVDEARPFLDRAGPRWLQVQVREVVGTEEILVTTSLRRDTSHVVAVKIGADGAWLRDRQPFPTDELTQDEEQHELEVVFEEPIHAPRPQQARILLPRRGDSTEASFELTTSRTEGPFEARIVVLHRNRALQTGVLRGKVVGRPDDLRLELEVDAAPRADLRHLGLRAPFDACLVTSRADGSERVLGCIGDRAESLSLQNVQPHIDRIAAALEGIADDPDHFAGGLRSTGSVELLWTLANHGSALHAGLVTDQFVDGALATAERLQVVAARAESFLPLELVYDRPAPRKGARLCRDAEAALKTGTCPDCPMDGSVICPLGFWGLSKVIERFRHDPRYGRAIGNDVAVLTEPLGERRSIDVFRAVVHGSSDRVELTDRRALARALEAASGTVRGAEAWEAWVAHVAEADPALLVLLPHVEPDGELGVPAMEIGTDFLASVHLGPRHVSPNGPRSSPVVLLLGCQTIGGADLASLTSAFRRHGAAAVVCTLQPVLGSHVGPLAGRIVELLRECRPERSSLGEVMRELRRGALLGGIPAALGLVAFGDADWWINGSSARQPAPPPAKKDASRKASARKKTSKKKPPHRGGR